MFNAEGRCVAARTAFSKRKYVPKCAYNSTLSAFSQLPAVLCAPKVDTETRFHPRSPPLDMICDNTVPPWRPCLIYMGSGPHATLIHGAKGGATSTQFKWTMQLSLNPFEPLDFVWWDHSLNDYDSPLENIETVRDSYFDQLLKIYPNIAGVGMVFWPENRHVCNAQKGGFISDLSALYTAVLPGMFGTPHGRFRNVSFVSASLVSFCNVLKCDTLDYLEPVNLHPSERGTTLMGDIAIYQLLPYFESIIRNNCPAFSSKLSGANGISNSVNTPEIVNAKYRDIYTILTSKKDEFKSPEITKTLSWQPVASFTMFSPNTAPPPPIDHVAIMCVSSTLLSSDFSEGRNNAEEANIMHYNYFNPFLNASINKTSLLSPLQVSWVATNIVALKQHQCAGWINIGARHPRRTDDDHGFSPTSIKQCPQGGGPFLPTCSMNDFKDWVTWKYTHTGISTGTTSGEISSYPHPFIISTASNPTFAASKTSKMDKVPPNTIQPVDIVVRVSNRVGWKYVWFEAMEECAPVIYWLLSASPAETTLKRKNKRTKLYDDTGRWRHTLLERTGPNNWYKLSHENHGADISSHDLPADGGVVTGLQEWINTHPEDHVLIVWHATRCFPFNLLPFDIKTTQSSSTTKTSGDSPLSDINGMDHIEWSARVEGVLVKGSLVLFAEE